MSLVPDRCICLRNVEYSETSQILLFMGREHGLMRLIARGAHRRTKAGASKFGGGIDLLDLGQAVFTDRPDKDLATLTEWTLLDGHGELRRSLRGLYLGFYAAELVSLLIEEHDPHPQLFDRLEQGLALFGTARAEQAFLDFELELLKETGYLPHLDACVSCGRPLGEREAVYFTTRRAGILCRNCEATYPEREQLDRRLLGLLHHMLALPRTNGLADRLPMLTRYQTDPINRILADHIQYTLGRRMRVARWVVGRLA